MKILACLAILGTCLAVVGCSGDEAGPPPIENAQKGEGASPDGGAQQAPASEAVDAS
ncbi:MAG TPA: hypothetical protein VM328_01825 [Fimbriimonadaceae bacterium]|nr:hypothetical protein [Fimbriimonadaceae bacterium]